MILVNALTLFINISYCNAAMQECVLSIFEDVLVHVGCILKAKSEGIQFLQA
jgi:hypothetical protein